MIVYKTWIKHLARYVVLDFGFTCIYVGPLVVGKEKSTIVILKRG